MIRHGESEANKCATFLGHADRPLTKLGEAQAEKTAEYLKNVQANAIYSSDLSRAYRTAECSAKKLNLPINKTEKLREIHAGLWENVPYAEIAVRYKKNYTLWLNDIGLSRCDGGESVIELQKRIVSTITEIVKRHDNQTILIFTHATPVRVFAAHCLNKSPEEIKTIPWSSNASITKAVYDGNSFTLLEYGTDDFMGDLVTRLPDNV